MPSASKYRLDNENLCRSVRKPLVEKMRRNRMNDSLEVLRQILITSYNHQHDSRTHISKMDKAVILELTVKLLKHVLTVNPSTPHTQMNEMWRPWL